MKAETLLTTMLRLIGTGGLAALIFVFCPVSWITAVHEWAGLGPLEPTPVFLYLARTLSAMYAFVGALLWLFSSDLDRYRPALGLFGWMAVFGGIGVTWLDAALNMPAWWTWAEGPSTAVFGLLILIWLSRLDRPARFGPAAGLAESQS